MHAMTELCQRCANNWYESNITTLNDTAKENGAIECENIKENIKESLEE